MSKIRHSRLVNKNRVNKSGLPPGTVQQTQWGTSEKIKITMFEFDDKSYTETSLSSIRDCEEALKRQTIKWIDIDGIHQPGLIEEIGSIFKIHPLTLEDIVNTDQRPKFEDYSTYTLSVLRMIHYDTCVHSEQLAIIMLENVVLTFQEENGNDGFDPVRDRIRNSKGRVRKSGADYLAYALIDAVIDTYFSILEKVGDKIEELEDELINGEFEEDLIKHIHATKREMIMLRRNLWPTREMLTTMLRSEHQLFSQSTMLYVRDALDHTIRILETIETQRELLTELTEIFLSSNSNKMNEVMKVLTVISSLFIPVTFIVGVYGMNFEYMPELKSKWAYPAVWVVMIGTIGGMLFYFKKKKWF